jgi:hypothetical protein
MEQRRFTGTGWPLQTAYLAFFNVKADPIDSIYELLAHSKDAIDVIQSNYCGHLCISLELYLFILVLSGITWYFQFVPIHYINVYVNKTEVIQIVGIKSQ